MQSDLHCKIFSIKSKAFPTCWTFIFHWNFPCIENKMENETWKDTYCARNKIEGIQFDQKNLPLTFISMTWQSYDDNVMRVNWQDVMQTGKTFPLMIYEISRTLKVAGPRMIRKSSGMSLNSREPLKLLNLY